MYNLTKNLFIAGIARSSEIRKLANNFGKSRYLSLKENTSSTR